MGLSLLGVTFSSTIISRCTHDFGHADLCGGDSGSRMLVVMVVMVVMVMMVAMDLWAIVKVCAAVYLIYSFPAWRLERGCKCSSYQNPVRILMSLATSRSAIVAAGCKHCKSIWYQLCQYYHEYAKSNQGDCKINLICPHMSLT